MMLQNQSMMKQVQDEEETQKEVSARVEVADVASLFMQCVIVHILYV